jgi:hypothetical protein
VGRLAVNIAEPKVSRGSKTRGRLCRRAGALAAALTIAVPAFASLGGSVKSVERDRTQMRATESVAHAGSYDVHEIRAAYGTVVDEYVSPGGTVFAVTWRGQFPPQMQQVMGSYFQEYADALETQQRQGYGHHPLNIQEPGLVVQTFGHMGAYFGRAYLPDRLPAGVGADQIQ